jgi:RimJ/RimL family protein N-acetyltransferase
MIANPSYRRKGLASECIRLMMNFIHIYAGISTFIAKIGDGNNGSMRLFKDKLNFQFKEYAECFEETTFQYVYISQHMQHDQHQSFDDMKSIPKKQD